MMTSHKCHVYFEVVGDGPTLLFIHAGVADSRMWDGQFETISGYQLVRFDMRGFGRSDLGSEPFKDHEDAMAVLDHLGVGNAVVVGCSIGGNAALQIADAAPERVDGLVLIGADAPGFDPQIDFQSPEWPEALSAFRAGDLERVAQLEAEMWLAGVGRSTFEMDKELVDLFVEMDLIALRNEEKRDKLDAATPLVRLPDIDSPVLAIAGERDIPQLKAAADRIAQVMSDRPSMVIRDSAHLPSMDRPEALNAGLTGFLASI